MKIVPLNHPYNDWRLAPKGCVAIPLLTEEGVVEMALCDEERRDKASEKRMEARKVAK
jgi:hypothetical protein